MRIILKKKGFFGTRRTVLNTKIMEVKPNSDGSDIDNKGLSIFFRDLDGSGVINLYPNEIESIGKINWKRKEKGKTPKTLNKREKQVLENVKAKKTSKKKKDKKEL